MTKFKNYDLAGYPPVLAWNPVVMRCPGCGLDEDPTYHPGHANKRCWHLRACDMHAGNSRIPEWQREIKAGRVSQRMNNYDLYVPQLRKRRAVIATQFMGDIGQVYGHEQKRLLTACREAPQHIFLWLTKWPERLAHLTDWPDNVWLGTSVSVQSDCERVDRLMTVPARHYWLSVEPMCGPMHVRPWLLSEHDKAAHDDQYLERLGGNSRRKLEFIAAGPETGPQAARPGTTNAWSWMYELASDCAESGVPFYDKRDPSSQFHTRREWPEAWKRAVGRAEG